MKAMRKFCSVVLCASLMCTVIAGCSSDEAAETNANAGEDAAEETEVQADSEVVSSDAPDTQEPETSRAGGEYSLAGMNADEIMDVIAYLSDVSAGDTVQSYYNKFPVEPMLEVSTCLYYFDRDNDSDDIVLSAGVISEVNEDGTFAFGCRTDGDYVDIVIDLSDEATSIEVYDRLFNLMCEACPGAEVTDDRDGNMWNSTVGTYELSRTGSGGNSIQVDIPIS